MAHTNLERYLKEQGASHKVMKRTSQVKVTDDEMMTYLQQVQDSIKPLSDKELAKKLDDYKWLHSKKQWEQKRQDDYNEQLYKVGLYRKRDDRTLEEKFNDVKYIAEHKDELNQPYVKMPSDFAIFCAETLGSILGTIINLIIIICMFALHPAIGVLYLLFNWIGRARIKYDV